MKTTLRLSASSAAQIDETAEPKAPISEIRSVTSARAPEFGPGEAMSAELTPRSDTIVGTGYQGASDLERALPARPMPSAPKACAPQPIVRVSPRAPALLSALEASRVVHETSFPPLKRAHHHAIAPVVVARSTPKTTVLVGDRRPPIVSNPPELPRSYRRLIVATLGLVALVAGFWIGAGFSS